MSDISAEARLYINTDRPIWRTIANTSSDVFLRAGEPECGRGLALSFFYRVPENDVE